MYEVIALTYDGKKIVKQTVTGTTINAGASATITVYTPLNEVEGLLSLNAVAPTPGGLSIPQNITRSTNALSFTIFASTTTTVSTFEVIVEGV